MIMTRPVRKLVLTAHVTFSVGWLGAVITSLVLAVAGLATADAVTVRAVYPALDLIGWYVLVPLSVASLITGLVQALAGPWGLLRHYWVVLKLTMNLFATVLLLLYTQTLGYLSDAAKTSADPADLLILRTPSPILHAAGALVLLGVAVTLSIYKPRGLTRYGQRHQLRNRQATARRL
jgi:hypothetical protein